jgi:hypothetical protein
MDNNKLKPEYILCAAIYFNDGKTYANQPKNIGQGFVITGRRHHNCYATLQAIAQCFGVEGIALKQIERIDRDNQGFITSTGRYVSRQEAFKIAKENNQIYHRAHDGVDEGMLISEDLY